MDTDADAGRPQRQDQTPKNNSSKHVDGKQKAKSVPMCLASQLDKLQSEQMITSMAVNLNNQEVESSEEISIWENFRKMACADMDKNECSRLLREMELEMEESDSDSENSDTDMDNIEIGNYSTTKRNLMAELEECVDTLDQHDEQQNKVGQKKKQKWGPTLLHDIPRRHIEDGRTILQKVTDLISVNNLESYQEKVPGNTCASFDVLENSYLADIASKVNIGLGKSSHAVTDNIDVLKTMEQEKCSNFVENHPKIMLPVNLEVDIGPVENTNKNDDSCDSEFKQGSLKEAWS
ncbi:hypothetical protein C2845_PM14G10500 [Panicum miliaceum]|uniref:Uncharacterized protein n=1 Tax=Panicum miliaceum TaxID=4540 RepID=A0A3L6PN37_PANMI|nr:hypothetical protein C2845_PM14G10500 [Panicum miliaceum]